MKTIILRSISFITVIFCLLSCQAQSDQVTPTKQETRQETRWYNLKSLGIKNVKESDLRDLSFDVEFSGADGDTFKLTSCDDIPYMGDRNIPEIEYVRWVGFKVDCEALNRFNSAPEEPVTSYWPETFDLSLLKTLPASATVNIGGQSLDGLKGVLGAQKSALTLIEAGEHNVKVDYDGMIINYVLLAKGDFNRDGYQDIFLMLDWYIKEAHGDGYDWVVVTKTAPDQAPMMLWRK